MAPRNHSNSTITSDFIKFPTTVDELTTRVLGFIVILLSSPGLYFNISVFFHFLSIPKTSFYLMCISKTVSNSLILLVNLLYNGPCAILDTILGSDFANRHLNQAIGFGVYLMGPLTQVLVAINRFLVVWRSVTNHSSKAGTIATVTTLFVLWLVALYFSTRIGLSNPCIANVTSSWNTLAESCENSILLYLIFKNFTYCFIFSGVFSNSLNLLVAMKLAQIACKTDVISSESAKQRHRSTVRLFSQSCIQDWIYVADMVKSLYISKRFLDDVIISFLTGIGTNVAVHMADGFVMFIFHYGASKKKRRDSTTTISKVLPFDSNE